MVNQKLCVLGGTGFVGQHLVARLNELKLANKVLTRRRQRQQGLLLMPYTDVVELDVFNVEDLVHEFQGCQTVINLVGILNEYGHDGHGFRRVHFELARKVLQAAQRSGVQQILHMSALNADAANSPSFYLRSKGEAEDYLHTFSGKIKLTSFRPSVIFGHGDSFFNRFAKLIKLVPGVFPLACAKSKFAPVYVGDVVDKFIQALSNPDMNHKRVNLCGPDIYTLQEIVEYCCAQLNVKRKIVPLPNFTARVQALLMEYFIPTRPFTLDNYYSLQVDSICDKAEVMPTGIDAVVPQYLGQNTKDKRYNYYRCIARRDVH